MLLPLPSNQQWKVLQNHRHTDNVSAARKTNTHTETRRRHTCPHRRRASPPIQSTHLVDLSPLLGKSLQIKQINQYVRRMRYASKGNKGDYAAMIRTCHTYLSYHWPGLLPVSTQHREQAPQAGSHSNTRTPVYRCLYWRLYLVNPGIRRKMG